MIACIDQYLLFPLLYLISNEKKLFNYKREKEKIEKISNEFFFWNLNVRKKSPSVRILSAYVTFVNGVACIIIYMSYTLLFSENASTIKIESSKHLADLIYDEKVSCRSLKERDKKKLSSPVYGIADLAYDSEGKYVPHTYICQTCSEILYVPMEGEIRKFGSINVLTIFWPLKNKIIIFTTISWWWKNNDRFW